MKVFLDANILVAVLNKEYPVFTNAARLLSLSANKQFTLYTSPVCLAIAFYFAEKKHGSKLAKSKVTLLTQHMEITVCGKKEAQLAAADPRILDFEDGLEYYAALHSGCACIVSEDRDDFYFSELEVLSAESFLRQHAVTAASKKL
jgi:predicted nucleic acid-binding protein